jgi:MFS family permease
MGSYFCFDIPASLNTYFLAAPFGYSSAKIASMYSIYSLPNTVLPLFGGSLIDKIGVK